MIPESPGAIRRTLKDLGHRPRKRLGQNFLADANIRDAIVRDAGVGEGDLVLEVGSGLGTLTKGLLAAGADVVAVEREPVLAEFLEEALAGEPRFTLLTRDVMERKAIAPEVREAIGSRRAAARRFLFVANLPYSVSTPLIVGLFGAPSPPDRGVVMVQKEVADRMAGRVGTSDYGPLAVLLALRAETRILREVGGQVFIPRPPVRSAVVSLTTRAGAGGDADLGTRTARRAFLHRRKSIRKALCTVGYDAGPVSEALAACGIEPSARPETVAPEAWVELGRRLPDPID
ncbi:MAG: 16S rRNA (adenine(1518)-N(6)/adenine(1519)-N(6))-dimethyltransferase RsmA [Planctomycetota bacterium]